MEINVTAKSLVERVGNRVLDEFVYKDRTLREWFDHIACGSPVAWFSVSDPPQEWRRENGDMVNYLIYVPEFGVDIGNYVEPAKYWLCMGVPCKPTHWAHLPQPPKGE